MATPRKVGYRIDHRQKELFGFVGDPLDPAANNVTERRFRHLVTRREISGGAQLPTGTTTRVSLAIFFGTCATAPSTLFTPVASQSIPLHDDP